MKCNKLILAAFVSTLFFASCTSDDDNNNPHNSQGTYDSGALVLNEGNFGTDNAEVSFISFDLGSHSNTVFSAENPAEVLGNTAQSIGFYGDLAYIVVNGSNKIEIVNRYTMKKTGSITTGLSQPRFIAFANGKGYVTNWGGTGYVAVINLSTNTVSAAIPVNVAPNKIIASNGRLYVAHNDLGTGNTVTVINASNDAIVTTITVGDLPDELVVDDSGVLWVSCQGKSNWPVPADESAGKILKINRSNNTVATTFTMPANTDHVSHFAVFGSNAYYTIDSKIYKFSTTATTLPIDPAFSSAAQYVYGFAVKNNKIYVADAKLFNTNGVVYVYSSGEIFDPNPVGTLLTPTPIEVGVGPNGFYFNQ